MDAITMGNTVKKLREKQKITQAALAERLNVSGKTISKWETGHGFPDITLLEPLAAALSVSVPELLSGETVINTNRAFRMDRLHFYVCPLCGNVLLSAGEAAVSCCGIKLPALEAEEADEAHLPQIEKIEDEYYVTLSHGMSKLHYISFLAAVRDDGCTLTKLYPEGAAEAHFRMARTRQLYWYCNRHGLFRMKIR